MRKHSGTAHRTMSITALVFQGKTFEIARRSLVSVCGLFVANLKVLTSPFDVHSRGSGAHFRLFLAAIDEQQQKSGRKMQWTSSR